MTLRQRVIRLAKQNPEIRKAVLPLLRKEARGKGERALVQLDEGAKDLLALNRENSVVFSKLVRIEKAIEATRGEISNEDRQHFVKLVGRAQNDLAGVTTKVNEARVFLERAWTGLRAALTEAQVRVAR